MSTQNAYTECVHRMCTLWLDYILTNVKSSYGKESVQRFVQVMEKHDTHTHHNVHGWRGRGREGKEGEVARDAEERGRETDSTQRTRND